MVTQKGRCEALDRGDDPNMAILKAHEADNPYLAPVEVL